MSSFYNFCAVVIDWQFKKIFCYSKPVGILRGHVTPIFYLFIVAEDNRLFSMSNDKTIKV